MKNGYTFINNNGRSISTVKVANETLLSFDKGRYSAQIPNEEFAYMLANIDEDLSFIQTLMKHYKRDDLIKILGTRAKHERKRVNK